jgi:hypothetical protein
MTVAQRLINVTDDDKVTLHFVHDFLEARLLLLKTIKVSLDTVKKLWYRA